MRIYQCTIENNMTTLGYFSNSLIWERTLKKEKKKKELVLFS